MLINGYEVTRGDDGAMRIVEIDSPAWRAMLKFCERFKHDAPEWGQFVVRHSAMQRRELDAAASAAWEAGVMK